MCVCVCECVHKAKSSSIYLTILRPITPILTILLLAAEYSYSIFDCNKLFFAFNIKLVPTYIILTIYAIYCRELHDIYLRMKSQNLNL
jgi:hypothetical protein